MFPKNSQNVVLIAEPYKSKEAFTIYGSKIGGLPVCFGYNYNLIGVVHRNTCRISLSL